MTRKVIIIGLLALIPAATAALAQQQGRPLPLSVTSSPIPAQVEFPQRFRVAPEVQATRLIRRVHAVYPQEAATEKVTGTVVLHAIISTDGTIQRLDFVSGPKIFEKATKDAVRRWLYKPTLVKGQPVEIDTLIRVTFLLDTSSRAVDPDSQRANDSGNTNPTN